MPKSSENVRKFSEELQNRRESPKIWKRFKTVYEEFLRLPKISENFWKFSETFTKSIGADFGCLVELLMLRASNDGKIEWNITRCIPQNMQGFPCL